MSALHVFLWCICYSSAPASSWQCVHVSLRETWNGGTSPINIHQGIQGDSKDYNVLPFIGNFFHDFPLATTQAVFLQLEVGLSMWLMVHGLQSSTVEIPRRQASRRVWLAILLRCLASVTRYVWLACSEIGEAPGKAEWRWQLLPSWMHLASLSKETEKKT